jgi:hypothetical protein
VVNAETENCEPVDNAGPQTVIASLVSRAFFGHITRYPGTVIQGLRPDNPPPQLSPNDPPPVRGDSAAFGFLVQPSL